MQLTNLYFNLKDFNFDSNQVLFINNEKIFLKGKNFALELFKNSTAKLRKTTNHSSPDAWLLSHYTSYLMRYNATLTKQTEAYRNKKNLTQNCVGVHIRRSDKIISEEAKLYKLGEYMEKVAIYFKNTKSTEKCVVLITDEIGLVEEVKR